MNHYSKEIEGSMLRLYLSLSEKDRRRYAAIETVKLKFGGLSYISKLFSVDPKTIRQGLVDLHESNDLFSDGIRKKGGGRNLKIINSSE